MGSCCVPGCSGRGGHRFPHKRIDIKQKWVKAILRIDHKTGKLWQPTAQSRVCKAHFVSSDYVWTHQLLEGGPRCLKPDAIPSLFVHSGPKKANPVKHQVPPPIEKINKSTQITAYDYPGLEEIAEAQHQKAIKKEESFVRSARRIVSPGGEKENSELCTDAKNRAIKHYTGFKNLKNFNHFFMILGSSVYDLAYDKNNDLTPREQLLMVLMKLRHGKNNIGLSRFFDITVDMVELLFEMWIDFLYRQLKAIIAREDSCKNKIDQNMTEELDLSSKETQEKKATVTETVIEIEIDDAETVSVEYSDTASAVEGSETIAKIICLSRTFQILRSVDFEGEISLRRKIIFVCFALRGFEKRFGKIKIPVEPERPVLSSFILYF